MFENLNELATNFDPVLIGVFAGLAMMAVQMLKKTFSFVDKNPMLYVMGLAIFFAGMVVYEITWVLEMAVITFLIMSAASGVYSASKNETKVELPDYSDET